MSVRRNKELPRVIPKTRAVVVVEHDEREAAAYTELEVRLNALSAAVVNAEECAARLHQLADRLCGEPPKDESAVESQPEPNYMLAKIIRQQNKLDDALRSIDFATKRLETL